jgi:predicted phage terminase large subunit-like protein
VGFQEAYYQYMFENGYSQVESVKVTADKRTRLALTTKLIKEGVIVFPKEGCEDLIIQLVGFGREHHDDLADAFSMLIMKILEEHDEGAGFRAWVKFCERNGGPWL